MPLMENPDVPSEKTGPPVIGPLGPLRPTSCQALPFQHSQASTRSSDARTLLGSEPDGFASRMSSWTLALWSALFAARSLEKASRLARNNVSYSFGFSPNGKNSLLRSSGAALVKPKSGAIPSARVRSIRTAISIFLTLGSRLSRTMPARATGDRVIGVSSRPRNQRLNRERGRRRQAIAPVAVAVLLRIERQERAELRGGHDQRAFGFEHHRILFPGARGSGDLGALRNLRVDRAAGGEREAERHARRLRRLARRAEQIEEGEEVLLRHPVQALDHDFAEAREDADQGGAPAGRRAADRVVFLPSTERIVLRGLRRVRGVLLQQRDQASDDVRCRPRID